MMEVRSCSVCRQSIDVTLEYVMANEFYSVNMFPSRHFDPVKTQPRHVHVKPRSCRQVHYREPLRHVLKGYVGCSSRRIGWWPGATSQKVNLISLWCRWCYLVCLLIFHKLKTMVGFWLPFWRRILWMLYVRWWPYNLISICSWFTGYVECMLWYQLFCNLLVLI